MALLWMDGFDHYGGSTGNMLNGVYAQVASSLSASGARTGTYRADIPQSNVGLRRVLGGDKDVVGVGMAMYLDSLPTSNERVVICQFRDSANAGLIAVGVETTGTIIVKRTTSLAIAGSGEIIAQTVTPVIVSEAYNHIEMAAGFDSVNGYIEIRVNGVTVINEIGVNTGANLCAQVAIGYTASGGASGRIDDIYAWDDTGTTNNDFLGDRRVRTIYPDSDTATAEWTVTGAASGFAAINQTSPDGDTTYIEADTNVPVTSEFGLEDLPASTGAIAAIQTYVMQRKTEAGDGSTQTSLISGASVANGADRPITEVYTYWMDVFEADPATGSAWTKAGVDAAKIRLRRTL